MKKALLFLFFLLLAGMTGGAFWVYQNRERFLKEVLSLRVSGVTGFETRIDRVTHRAPAHFDLYGVRLSNPPSFENPVFAEAKKILIDLDFETLWRERKLRLRLVRVELDEINIEKRKDGISNVRLLKTMTKQNLGISEEAVSSKPRSFYLERLEIVSRKITYRDATGVLPKKFVTDLEGEEKVFEEIPSADVLVNIIIAETLKGGKLDSVVLGLGPIFIERSLKGFGVKSKAVAQSTAGVFVEGAEAMAQGSKKVPEVLTKTAGEVFKVTKVPLELFEKKVVSSAGPKPRDEEIEPGGEG
jgi:hypothetical protein